MLLLLEAELLVYSGKYIPELLVLDLLELLFELLELEVLDLIVSLGSPALSPVASACCPSNACLHLLNQLVHCQEVFHCAFPSPESHFMVEVELLLKGVLSPISKPKAADPLEPSGTHVWYLGAFWHTLG